jgi:hypothetical protein
VILYVHCTTVCGERLQGATENLKPVFGTFASRSGACAS